VAALSDERALQVARVHQAGQSRGAFVGPQKNECACQKEATVSSGFCPGRRCTPGPGRVGTLTLPVARDPRRTGPGAGASSESGPDSESRQGLALAVRQRPPLPVAAGPSLSGRPS
jgi:hypothetical protein